MTTHYSNFLTAIGTLSRGHLPAFLFTETILTNMLDTVQTSVNKEFGKSIDIVHKHVHYYYNKGSFICTRHQDNLYITLKIPLTNIPDQFQLYRIKTYPIPLHKNEYSHVTKIENVPDNIAISPTKGIYLPISNNDWNNFIATKDTQIHRIFQSIDPYNCIMGIFFDDKPTIKSKCAFSIIMQSIQPNVQHLFDDTFLLTNISTFTQTCGSRHIQSQCSVCILDIHPYCSLEAGTIIIPQLTNTNSTNAITTKPQYIVNLAVLLNLFDNEQIANIAGDAKFFTPPDIAIPTYTFYTNALSHNFVESEEVKLNLRKASDAVKNDEEIVQNLGQAIIMGKVDIDVNFFFSPPGIVLQITCILVILLILNSLYVSYKLKQALITISIIHAKITSATCSDQLNLNYYKASSDGKPSDTFISIQISEYSLTIAICIGTFCIISILLAMTLRQILINPFTVQLMFTVKHTPTDFRYRIESVSTISLHTADKPVQRNTDSTVSLHSLYRLYHLIS